MAFLKSRTFCAILYLALDYWLIAYLIRIELILLRKSRYLDGLIQPCQDRRSVSYLINGQTIGYILLFLLIPYLTLDMSTQIKLYQRQLITSIIIANLIALALRFLLYFLIINAILTRVIRSRIWNRSFRMTSKAFFDKLSFSEFFPFVTLIFYRWL